MKIGITFNSSNQLFSGEAEHTALIIYNLLSIYYDVILIDKCNSNESDINDIFHNYPIKSIFNISEIELDLLIDIDGLVYPSDRKRIAKQTIIFLQTFVQFSELEKSVYDLDSVPRNFTGVSEIWCWDILNPPQTLKSIQTLFQCPIKTIPFYWNNNIQYNKHNIQYNNNQPWNIYVCENNPDAHQSNIYSSVLPITSIPEIVRQFPHNYNSFKVQINKSIKENKFLKENILNNINPNNDINLEFYDKLPYYKLKDVNALLISHTRFTQLNIGLLDALFLGIPTIHNSLILKNLHPILEKMYYSNNNISEICNCLKWFKDNNNIWFEQINSIRKCILDTWDSLEIIKEWKNRIDNLLIQTPLFNSDATPTFQSQSHKLQKKETLIIAFSDFWPGFNYNSNFITDSLRNEVYKNGLDITIRGIPYSDNTTPNVILFGPYSENWKSISSNIPKVFFTAENWKLPDTNIALLLTPYKNNTSTNHIRLPTWMTFIDWFSNSKELPTNLDDNPIRFPVHFIRNTNSKPFSERKEFCGFVVSNPVCSLRNETYLAVNEYKKINSGGALYNNIGGQLSLKYPGGGCGDISKYHFLSEHKFQLCFENSQAPGYITEKVMHSKIAGCVPIYWGDSDTSTDFVSGSFINVSNLSTPNEILEQIKEVEQDISLCENITNTPLLDDEKYNNALSIISNISKRILGICGINLLNKIDKTIVINLDRRADRWENWCKDNSTLSTIAHRFSAVDGKQVKLTQNIYNIFKYNNFNWKRAMVGCTLSHMSVWLQLLAEPDGVNSYLVLEDDMRFTSNNWLIQWEEISKDIPEDAEIMYIGGVLPSNKKALPLVLEPVNNSWAKIKPNTLFGTKTPQPIFHFCAYSYIITKKGAQKLLDWLAYSKEKCFSCNDHLMGHPIVDLNKYISIPLITKCFQEDDTNYLNSDFNTVDRADTFDSDIWSSIDNFSSEELAQFSTGDETISHIWIPIWETLKNMNVLPLTKKLLWPQNFIKSLKNDEHKNIIQTYTQSNTQFNIKININDNTSPTTIYYLKEYEDKNGNFNLYEKNWVKDIFGNYIFKVFDGKTIVPSGSWFIAMRPFSNELNKLFTYMHSIKQDFKVLHFSDEFGKDNIEYYKLASCKMVLRTYIRPDLLNLSNVLVIPLGYHYKDVYNTDIEFSDRKYIWSFHGTNWFNRKILLNNIIDITPHSLHYTPDWNHSTMTNEAQYINILTNSKFCPIVRGNNVETFRLYESLEHGVIPLYVRNEGDDDYWKWITEHIKLIEIKDWITAKSVIQFFLQNPEKAEKYRQGLIKGWESWKHNIQTFIAS